MRGIAMKKVVVSLIVAVFTAIASFSLYRFYIDQKMANQEIKECGTKHGSQNPEQVEDIQAFFTWAKERLPLIPEEIKELKTKSPVDDVKLSYLQDELIGFKIAMLIAERNIAELEKMNLEDLQKGIQIWVPADRFKNNREGTLASRILGGGNALAFVIFYSATDKTCQDQKKIIRIVQNVA